MNTYIVICVSLFFAPSIFGLNEIFQRCANKTGVTETEVNAAMHAREIPDNVKMNAFAKCQMLQSHAIHPNGYINEQHIFCQILELCDQFRGKKVNPRELYSKFLYLMDNQFNIPRQVMRREKSMDTRHFEV